MDFKELQLKRESCRIYSDKPVPRELLTELIEVARLSPSACNSQPWKFIVVDEPEACEKVREAFEDGGVNGCTWGKRVPAFILICEDEAHLMPGVGEHYGSQHFAQMDIGMTAMSICYEATTLGLGSCMIGTMNQEKLKKAFNIPEERTVRLIITIGYPAREREPRKKIRKNLEDIISFNKW